MSEDFVINIEDDDFPVSNVKPSGPQIALALSGGGTRGYAHIGVLSALEEAGIGVAALAGCSAGGMIGGLYAVGYSPDEMKAEVRKLTSVRGLVRSVLPSRGSDLGFFQQLRFDNRFRENLGNFVAPDFTFAETRVPFAVNAVCLNTGEEVMLSSGSVSDAIRATVSVPGVFPSVEIDGLRYVDGGVLNNVPVSAVRSLSDAPVLAIDVGNVRPISETMLEQPSRLRPRIAIDFRATVDIMTTRLTQLSLEKSPPDLLIRPKLPRRLNPLSDLTQIETIIAAGYTATRAAMPQIKLLFA